jgi:hypothetical protein
MYFWAKLNGQHGNVGILCQTGTGDNRGGHPMNESSKNIVTKSQLPVLKKKDNVL